MPNRYDSCLYYCLDWIVLFGLADSVHFPKHIAWKVKIKQMNTQMVRFTIQIPMAITHKFTLTNYVSASVCKSIRSIIIIKRWYAVWMYFQTISADCIYTHTLTMNIEHLPSFKHLYFMSSFCASRLSSLRAVITLKVCLLAVHFIYSCSCSCAFLQQIAFPLFADCLFYPKTKCAVEWECKQLTVCCTHVMKIWSYVSATITVFIILYYMWDRLTG